MALNSTVLRENLSDLRAVLDLISYVIYVLFVCFIVMFVKIKIIDELR